MRVMHPSVVSALVRSPRHQRGSSARLTATRRMLAAGFLLAAVALLLLAGATTPARAADDVANDAALSVVVRDGGDGSVLASAEVRVTARRDGEAIGVRGGVTATDGSATFDGLASRARRLPGDPRRDRTARDHMARRRRVRPRGRPDGRRERPHRRHRHGRRGRSPTPRRASRATSSGPDRPRRRRHPRFGRLAPRTRPRSRRRRRTPGSRRVRPSDCSRAGAGSSSGSICFAVVLGLAWPDHRDRG